MPDQPNILLLMTDQWRGDALGCAGHPEVMTPNIDHLFQEGVNFTQAYSAVPSCIAARAGLMTGLNQRHHGRVGYRDRVDWNYPVNLAGELGKAGYHTQCVGKMHVFPARNLMGFHNVVLHDGYLHNERCRPDDYRLVDDYLPWLQARRGPDADITDAGPGCNGYTVHPWPYHEMEHPTSWVTTQSIDFLRRRDPSKPFFLKASYHRPHPPFDPPQVYLDMYRDADTGPVHMGDWAKPFQHGTHGYDSPKLNEPKHVRRARQGYYAHLTHIDTQINRLIHGLYESGEFNNTLIMFVSDHGDMLFDHNLTAKGRGYDGCARVPMFMKLPDSWGKPEVDRVNLPVELRDIMPTFLDAAGADIPAGLDGLSLLPLARQTKKEWREYVHGEHSGGANSNHWINTGREMYIWYSQTGEEQYFDLENDPHNCRNLAEEKKSETAALRDCLIRELEGREEGYVKDGQLVTGCTPQAVLAEAGLPA